MSKLDVGVGDEFPTEEIRRDSDGVVHHHHYYYRRGPFRFLRIVLVIALITLVFRLVNMVTRIGFWPGWPYPRAYFPIGGAVTGILVIGIVLGLFYWRDRDGF
jgi:hypothetical protein